MKYYALCHKGKICLIFGTYGHWNHRYVRVQFLDGHFENLTASEFMEAGGTEEMWKEMFK